MGIAHNKAPAGSRQQSPEIWERDGFEVRIIRSERRVRTVSARQLNWRTLEIRAPATLGADKLEPLVERFVSQAAERRGKQRLLKSDAHLDERARRLNQRYFEGKLRWSSLRFVSNQKYRFGSCTPTRGTIRISERLAQVPDWVLDYVLMHEMAHLVEPNHSTAFWKLVYRYELTERARGYLMALQLEEDADMDVEEGA